MALSSSAVLCFCPGHSGIWGRGGRDGSVKGSSGSGGNDLVSSCFAPSLSSWSRMELSSSSPSNTMSCVPYSVTSVDFCSLSCACMPFGGLFLLMFFEGGRCGS